MNHIPTSVARGVLAGAMAGAMALAASIGSAFAAGGKLVIAESFPPTAGWAMESDDPFVLTRVGCLEGLARVDFEGQVIPALATGWEQVSPTEWDFTIREGVKFHNGEALDAAAVAAALNHVLGADAPARSFSPKVVASVAAARDMTVRITTPNPSVLLPLRLASPNTGILAPAAYAGEQIDPVGTCTGPFRIVEHIPEQALRLERNAEYWGGDVRLEAAEMRFVLDGGVRATQIRTGEAHLSRVIPASAIEELKTVEGVNVITVETARTNGLYLNNARAPFDNVNARRAVQSAIDAAAIAATIYEGSAQPAVGPFAPNEPWAPTGASGAAYDPERAKRLLAEAGIDAGALDLTLLVYTERAELPDLAAVVQAQLQQIGVKAEIRSSNWSGIETDLYAGNFDLFLMSRNHLIDVADPIAFLAADYTCEGGFNISNFCDPAVDALVDEARGTADPSARNALYAQVAARLQDEAVTVFLVHIESIEAVSEKVQGYRMHPLAHYVLVPELGLAE
ncbi:MAG: ABC transporter substrate-binding protein [Thiotrichales bacterium]|nr:ABC transporter substrate-binding protein [Thiotrichales bacterium]